MKFVVDTNIIFSAILNTNGKIGDLLLNSTEILEFYTCDTLSTEINNHYTKLKDISGLTDEQLDVSSRLIISRLNFINEAIIPFENWQKSANLVREVDMDDIAFVALSEFLQVKLWTGDKKLIKELAKKGYLNFITTDELFNLRALLE